MLRMREVLYEERQFNTPSTELYCHHHRQTIPLYIMSCHLHTEATSHNNTLLPSTPHYLTVYHAPPAHIHSPIQTTSTIINNYTTPPNITSAHHVPVPSSVSTLYAYTKNHASRGESVQPPPLYQHHQNDKGVVGSHLSGQLYGTTPLYTGWIMDRNGTFSNN